MSDGLRYPAADCPHTGLRLTVCEDCSYVLDWDPKTNGLDVADLAYAISAAEGFPGWTPWSSETVNAELIARAYEVIHNREPGTDRAIASAVLATPTGADE